MFMFKHRGFTLIELMLAILIGSFVTSAIVVIYIDAIDSSADTVNSAQLNHDLGTAVLLMSNDIRRAGYWADAVTGSDARNNPFTQGNANIQIPNANCILYTYDGGALEDGNVDGDEYYGFKLNNGTIQIRSSGTTTADCDDGNWDTILNITDVEITNLTFSFVTTASIPNITATSNCLNTTLDENVAKNCSAAIADGDFTATAGEYVETRQVLYRVDGTLDNDATVTKSIVGSVNIKNDRLFTQP